MALSKNKAVREAYAAGTYTDARGHSWRRGMDGWFLEGVDYIMVSYHHDMVEMIEKEHPEDD